jgi:hypothetical protein
MRQREEEQYPIQQRLGQEQPEPSTGKQIILVLAFLGFIIAIPTIAERLGK